MTRMNRRQFIGAPLRTSETDQAEGAANGYACADASAHEGDHGRDDQRKQCGYQEETPGGADPVGKDPGETQSADECRSGHQEKLRRGDC